MKHPKDFPCKAAAVESFQSFPHAKVPTWLFFKIIMAVSCSTTDSSNNVLSYDYGDLDEDGRWAVCIHLFQCSNIMTEAAFVRFPKPYSLMYGLLADPRFMMSCYHPSLQLMLLNEMKKWGLREA